MRRSRADAGSEGRGAADEVFLKGPLALVEQGAQQPGPIAEAPEQGALADAGGAGDLVHRHAVRAPLRDEPLGGAEDRVSVARRVGALRRNGFEHRQPNGRLIRLDEQHLRCIRTVVHLCYCSHIRTAVR
jgi:hypothetical protein